MSLIDTLRHSWYFCGVRYMESTLKNEGVLHLGEHEQEIQERKYKRGHLFCVVKVKLSVMCIVHCK